MSILEKGKIAVGWLDAQWGSSGKGKFNTMLALTEEPDFAISQNSTQASHWSIDPDGNCYKFQHLPTSVVYPGCKVIIGAGSVIDLPTMIQEIEDWKLDQSRLFIHPNAAVITESDIEYEKKHLMRIASTMTGVGSAVARKVMRHPDVVTADMVKELKPFLANTYDLMLKWVVKNQQKGILETCQGFDLSIDHSMVRWSGSEVKKSYPYCTSRNVDPLSLAGVSGIPRSLIGNVLMTVRTFPIRVGDATNNKIDGRTGLPMEGSYAGDCWPDQHEMTWEEITRISGSEIPIKETTSLTKRTRRVFSFSRQQIHHATGICQPDFFAVNFANYLDSSISGMSARMTLQALESVSPSVAEFVREVESSQWWNMLQGQGKVKYIGTGPKSDEQIEIL